MNKKQANNKQGKTINRSKQQTDRNKQGTKPKTLKLYKKEKECKKEQKTKKLAKSIIIDKKRKRDYRKSIKVTTNYKNTKWQMYKKQNDKVQKQWEQQ